MTSNTLHKPPLHLEEFNGGRANHYANQTLVMGERDTVLIDAPFTRSQAHRIVATILDTGLNLTHIYVTHSHPDHYFSAPVLLEAFPHVELIAVPKVCLNIAISIPGRIKAWSGMLGVNGPINPIVPKPYIESFIELEGQQLDILGPMAGDHPDSTTIYIPVIDAIITGDIVLNGTHLFLTHGKEDYRQRWLESLDYLISLNPITVIAGHCTLGRDHDQQALQYSRDYLLAFEEAVAKANTSDEVVATMKNRFPDSTELLEGITITFSARVALGEMEPVPETLGIDD
ncbi:MAG: MBL fold metallo-hydrolase [Chloroflexota bacterium]